MSPPFVLNRGKGNSQEKRFLFIPNMKSLNVGYKSPL